MFRIPASSLVAAAFAGLAIAPAPLHAGVVFSESFEAPVVSGFATNTVPSGGKWIGATTGFGATERGLYNETFSWPATAAFTTPYGSQAYYLNYSNSGLTSSVGATGQTLTAGVTYKVTFNAAVAAGTASGSYWVQLVAFGAADNNTARANCQTLPGTVLASATGTVTTRDLSAAGVITFTPDGSNAHLGKDVGIRILKSTNSVLYDNIRLVTGHDMQPSPASGTEMPAGNTVLSWSNMPPTPPATNTYVDVWFGTNPSALTQVVDGQITGTTNVNAPAAGTYYWRVDSYPDGNPNGTPVSGDLFTFVVSDSDGDGLPDAYELANTSPASATALNPADDLDTDGLTNAQEYFYGSNPNNPDTDNDTLLDGPELAGVGSRPPTSPVDADSDDDGLSDGVETNTGTWVNAADTGTNPKDADWDKDGLKDGAETNTGTYVDRFNSGSNPFLADTDADGAGDWYEATATFTNPNSGASAPSIPYPLPDPLPADTGNAAKPVKVYIMAGQSNTVGIGQTNGTSLGTLETVTKRENKFPNLIDGSGNWTKRNDVIYKGVISATAEGPLTAGQGASNTQLGPELGFGQIMGWYHDEPVLIIKASQGNRSLAWDFCPPGNPRWTYTDKTYAAYGESPGSWLTAGGAPSPGGSWYAGKQYDDCFLAESAMGMSQWTTATAYPSGGLVRNNGVAYSAKSAHTSDSASEPGVGASWSTYWSVYTITNASDLLNFTNNTLQNLPTTGNNLNGRTFEIAGFCWWQGHKDQDGSNNPYATRYEQNLAQLITALRASFHAPNAPFVVATIGFGGEPLSTKENDFKQVYNAQLAVGNPTLHPEFAGTVKSVDILKYWRTIEESPKNQDYHYNQNAETYMLVGDAMGRAMISLDVDATPPVPNPLTFAIAPSAAGTGTVAMVATTASDVSGPVEYYFENITTGQNSGWTTSTRWDNTGLAAGTYDYHVKARDSKSNETSWSATATAPPGNDVTAPAPAPQFSGPITVLGENSLSMNATTASDINGVQYYFECTVGGGPNSGWQSGTAFTATGLTAGSSYTYVVRAKDSLGNTTANSTSASATTTPPDTTPPTPGTMSFATPPAASGTSNITMTATTASDPSGVEYYFEETSGNSGGTSSGWQDSPSYTDSGLQPGTQYTYRVRARDKSPAHTPNGWSSTASATTGLPDTTAPAVVSFSPADGAIDVALTNNLVITFSEEIVQGTGLITIKNLSDSTQTTIDITDGAQVTASGSTLTINPTTSLVPGKNYAVQIAGTAIVDLSDNPYAGISDDTTWNFASAVVPYVWAQTAGNAQDWTVGSNWQGGNVPSPIAGDTIDFSTVNIAANTTLTLGADRTAQLWKFGDTSGTQTWTVNAGNSMILAGTTPTIQVNNATTTLNNVVAGSAGLVKTGGGTLALSNAANTYTGGTTINGGNLTIAGDGSLGAAGTTVTVNANATMNVPNNIVFNRPFVINNGASLAPSVANAVVTVNGAVTGTGSIAPYNQSNASLTLASTGNTFTGNIQLASGIQQGTIIVNSIGDGGNVNLGTQASSGTNYGQANFRYGTGATAPLVLSTRTITLGTAGGGKGVIQNDNTANSHANTITINTDLLAPNSGARTLELAGANTGANTFAGKLIDGNGTVSLNKAGTGNWTISNPANTFSGTITLNSTTTSAGTLSYVSAPGTNPITFLQTTGSATLRYNGSSPLTMSGLISAAALTSGTITLDASGTAPAAAVNYSNTASLTAVATSNTVRKLILTGENTGANTFAGALTNNTGTTNAATLTKNGGGTWVLTGNNAHTGTTSVNAGKLFINGDQTAANGAVSVSANATLGGTGIIGGATTIAANGKLEFNLSAAAASHDKLDLAAGKALTFSGASTLTLTSSGGASPGTYTLLSAPGGINGSVPATVVLPSGWTASAPQITGAGNTDLVITITSTGTVQTPYDAWSGGSAFDADANNDGVKNGLAWVLGASNKDANAISLLPVYDNTSDPAYFIFTYRRADAANTDANTGIAVQYGDTLGGWTNAVHDGTNVIITPTDNFYAASPGVDKVEVKIKKSLVPGGKMFVRLKTVKTP